MLIAAPVNILKGRLKWDERSQFDANKDKTKFRQFETACDRVRCASCRAHAPHALTRPPQKLLQGAARYAACPRAPAARTHPHPHACPTEKQTVAFNIRMRANFRKQTRARMGVWRAMEMLDTLVDDSDPDTSLSQIEHLLQTAEAMRRDGKPEWMQVVGLVHDLGKLLFMFGSECVLRALVCVWLTRRVVAGASGTSWGTRSSSGAGSPTRSSTPRRLRGTRTRRMRCTRPSAGSTSPGAGWTTVRAPVSCARACG